MNADPKQMSMRQRHIFVVEFLLSGETPGRLLAERKIDEAQLVMDYIRKGPPVDLAFTDPSLFVRLRNAITKLMVKGWI